MRIILDINHVKLNIEVLYNRVNELRKYLPVEQYNSEVLDYVSKTSPSIHTVVLEQFFEHYSKKAKDYGIPQEYYNNYEKSIMNSDADLIEANKKLFAISLIYERLLYVISMKALAELENMPADEVSEAIVEDNASDSLATEVCSLDDELEAKLNSIKKVIDRIPADKVTKKIYSLPDFNSLTTNEIISIFNNDNSSKNYVYFYIFKKFVELNPDYDFAQDKHEILSNLIRLSLSKSLISFSNNYIHICNNINFIIMMFYNMPNTINNRPNIMHVFLKKIDNSNVNQVYRGLTLTSAILNYACRELQNMYIRVNHSETTKINQLKIRFQNVLFIVHHLQTLGADFKNITLNLNGKKYSAINALKIASKKPETCEKNIDDKQKSVESLQVFKDLLHILVNGPDFVDVKLPNFRGFNKSKHQHKRISKRKKEKEDNGDYKDKIAKIGKGGFRSNINQLGDEVQQHTV